MCPQTQKLIRISREGEREGGRGEEQGCIRILYIRMCVKSFQISSPKCTMHTAVGHTIQVLKWWSFT